MSCVKTSQRYFVPNTAAYIRLVSKLRGLRNIEDFVHELGYCWAANNADVLRVCGRTERKMVQHERREEM